MGAHRLPTWKHGPPLLPRHSSAIDSLWAQEDSACAVRKKTSSVHVTSWRNRLHIKVGVASSPGKLSSQLSYVVVAVTESKLDGWPAPPATTLGTSLGP